MKETRFIAQNKEKWQESENLLEESEKDPEKLSNLFTQVIDDLSYSRTYYPNRSVRVYLNRIAREYFSIIYSHHKSKKNAFTNFWLDELPQIVYQSRKPLIISLIIFVVSLSIGIFSSFKDPEFTSSILGERYVSMTKANIEKGDPMAVYKDAHQVEMFLGITINNLMVAFRTYVFGVFLSIGTIAILLYNGIMVGCFQFFFIERGLFAESALTIWLHGTLEISSIILAGGAGLTLGSGLLFPGSYSRLQAFQITAMRSLKLMLGITPIFVLAAIIESFLTRYTDVPDALRLFLILLSAFIILGYFVLYPWMKARKGFDHPLEEVKLPPATDELISVARIKSNGEIIKDSFHFYKKFSHKLAPWIVLVAMLAAAAEFFAPTERLGYYSTVEQWMYLFSNLYYAMKTTSPVHILINTVAITLILYRVFRLLEIDTGLTDARRFHFLSAFQTFFVTALAFAILFFWGGWGVFLIISFYPMFLLVVFTQFRERNLVTASISRVVSLTSENFGQVLSFQVILLMMSFSFLLILSAPLLYMNTTILEWNFAETDVWSRGIVRFIEIFVKLVAFYLIVPVFASSIGYLYFSLKEIHSAEYLRGAIGGVGHKYKKTARL